MRTITAAALLAIAVLALPACDRDVAAVDAAAPSPPVATSADGRSGHVNRFGERIEVRPGVFATVTAHVRSIADQQSLGPDGKLVDVGPKTDHVTIAVAYENQTAEPLGGMGTMNLGSATLDGQAGTMSMRVDETVTAMESVHPGHTGQLATTVTFPPPWHRGDPIEVQVAVPALRSEVEAAGPYTQTMPLAPPVWVTDTPTSIDASS